MMEAWKLRDAAKWLDALDVLIDKLAELGVTEAQAVIDEQGVASNRRELQTDLEQLADDLDDSEVVIEYGVVRKYEDNGDGNVMDDLQSEAAARQWIESYGEPERDYVVRRTVTLGHWEKVE